MVFTRHAWPTSAPSPIDGGEADAFGGTAAWAMPMRLLRMAEAGDIGACLAAPGDAQRQAGWLVTCLSGRFVEAPTPSDASFAWWPATGRASSPLGTTGPALLACLEPTLGLLRHAAAELAVPALPSRGAPMLRADAALVQDMLDYVHRATDRAHPAGRFEMDCRAALISLDLLRRHLLPPVPRRSAGGLAPWQLAHACQALTRNLAYPPGLAELAASLGLSRFHFLRAFKRCTGLPPHAWLVEQRLLHAKRLLLSDASLPIAELAGALGYDGGSQFARLFRRREGMTPSEFRRGARS
jgi:AraC-like DNA-binding protein